MTAAARVTVTFLVTAINTTSSLVNLNSDSFVAAPLTVDHTAFQNDWFDLTASQTVGPEALFAVDVPLGTTPGNYLGR